VSGGGTRSGPGEHAAAIGPAMRDALGRIRRMAISVTSKALWQVLGHLLLDGSTEARDAEVFTGIGFYSRPSSSGKPEAIVVFPGGPGNPVVVATRDEQTRKSAAGSIAENETAVFNTLAMMLIKAAGIIELRSIGGVATPPALKSDLDTLKAAISGAAVVAGDGGAAFKANILAALAAWPVGAQKVKVE
jgi:hypothetical protein